ncbi:MAG: hypothetical protein KC613_23380 [Myxococcales bacterium]|nr:hypothetical protein [Myxococcales bacterium]
MQRAALIPQAWAAWQRFWFAGPSPVALDGVRAAVGVALLVVYGPLGDDLGRLYGPHGWAPPAAAVADLGEAAWWSPLDGATSVALAAARWGLLAAGALLTVGVASRAASIAAWLGHLAFMHRAPLATYGVDYALASLLFVLALAPTGRILALWPSARPYGDWGRACLRAIQVQWAVAFLFAGFSKLRGDAWWHGWAVWDAMAHADFAPAPGADLLARSPILVNLLTYGALVVELGYPVGVWTRLRRAWVLAALALHLGIALTLDLWAFSFVMAAGHLAFWPAKRSPGPSQDAQPLGDAEQSAGRPTGA